MMFFRQLVLESDFFRFFKSPEKQDLINLGNFHPKNQMRSPFSSRAVNLVAWSEKRIVKVANLDKDDMTMLTSVYSDKFPISVMSGSKILQTIESRDDSDILKKIFNLNNDRCLPFFFSIRHQKSSTGFMNLLSNIDFSSEVSAEIVRITEPEQISRVKKGDHKDYNFMIPEIVRSQSTEIDIGMRYVIALFFTTTFPNENATVTIKFDSIMKSEVIVDRASLGSFEKSNDTFIFKTFVTSEILPPPGIGCSSESRTLPGGSVGNFTFEATNCVINSTGFVSISDISVNGLSK